MTDGGAQACLNEGMRVYPPVPTLTREAERSIELGGYHIEKGTMLGVAVFSMHNNPAYWKVHQHSSRCAPRVANFRHCRQAHASDTTQL